MSVCLYVSLPVCQFVHMNRFGIPYTKTVWGQQGLGFVDVDLDGLFMWDAGGEGLRLVVGVDFPGNPRHCTLRRGDRGVSRGHGRHYRAGGQPGLLRQFSQRPRGVNGVLVLGGVSSFRPALVVAQGLQLGPQ